MEIELRGKLSASIQSTVEENFSVNTTNTMNLGLAYTNAQWQTTYTKTSSSSVAITNFNDSLKAKLELSLIPYVSFRLYRVAGPYASFGLRELVQGNLLLPAGDWDFYAGAWLQTIVGARAGIFSKSWVDINKEWNTDTIYYKTPDKIQRVSGDNQKGTIGQYLSAPIVVKVVDNNGSPQAKVPVYFTVTDGDGTLDKGKVLTSEKGEAQTKWKLGNSTAIQKLKVEAKTADGKLIKDAPIDFAAIVEGDSIILTTNNISSIAATTAVSGGNITNDGGSTITARGVCWNTLQNPSIADNKTSTGAGTGSFTSNITGLISNTTYYVRAYATNSAGTTYGNEVSFITGEANLNNTLWEGTLTTDLSPQPQPVYCYLIIDNNLNAFTSYGNSSPPDYYKMNLFKGAINAGQTSITWNSPITGNESYYYFTFDAPWTISGNTMKGNANFCFVHGNGGLDSVKVDVYHYNLTKQ